MDEVREKLGVWNLWTTRLEGGAWTSPKNLGPDVNSAGTTSDPELSNDGQTLYFAGLRSGGQGLSDLWSAQEGVFEEEDDGRNGNNGGSSGGNPSGSGGGLCGALGMLMLTVMLAGLTAMKLTRG